MADDRGAKKEEPWWLALLAGLLLLGGSVWIYIDLTRFEAEGGARKMKWLLVVLYNTLGKWGVVGFMVLGGCGAILHGLSQLRTKRAGRGDADPPPVP
jgi:hypothetical protein